MSYGGRSINGFTLIEVLVALVVASLILTVVMSASIFAQSRQLRAEEHERAVLAAAALIARQVVKPAGVSLTRGHQDKLAWELEEQELVRDPRGFFVLDRVEVRLFDPHGKLIYSAATRKLKEVAQP